MEFATVERLAERYGNLAPGARQHVAEAGGGSEAAACPYCAATRAPQTAKPLPAQSTETPTTEKTPPAKTPSADSQLEALWAQVTALAPAADSPVTWPRLGKVYDQVRDGSYSELLADRGDVAPSAGANDGLCAVGAVARASIEWDVSATCGPAGRWTGCFGGNSSGEGLLRISTAMRPPFGEESSLPAALKLGGRIFAGSLKDAKCFPCAAFKLPRGSGAPSANLLFGGRKVGVASAEIFTASLGTVLTEKAAPPLRPLIDSFRRYSQHPTQLGVSDFATYDRDGGAVATPCDAKFPWCLVLVPTADARAAAAAPPKAPSGSAHPLEGDAAILAQLLRVPAGTVLYDVYAVASPIEALPGPAAAGGLSRVGKLVSRSRFVRNTDESRILRFWHQRREADYELRPEWRPQITDHHRDACGAEHLAAIVARR